MTEPSDDPAAPPRPASSGSGVLATTAERETAFLELIQTYGPRLRRIAGSYARGAEREDLHQEILCQIWRSLAGFRGDAALGTWLYRVALNTALTWVRLRARRPLEVRGPEGGEGLHHPITAGAPGSEDAILDDFLLSLGAEDRSLLVLYLDGLGHREIAEVTALTTNAVAVRLHRIKRRYEQRYLEVPR